MYVNHENAKKTFNTLLQNEASNWIIISGNENSGKTSFIKEVCSIDKTLFCEPQIETCYLKGFISYIVSDWNLYVKNYLIFSQDIFVEIKRKYNIKYIDDIDNKDYNNIVYTLLKRDINEYDFRYAAYLGGIFNKKYSYIVLDNFFKCDLKSYNWLLTFTESFLKNSRYVIAICDLQKKWESSEVYEALKSVSSLIDLKYFEEYLDYYNVLKENIYFENTKLLEELSKKLFDIFKKDACLLFKTIKIYDKDRYIHDNDRYNNLLQIAHNLTVDSFNLDKTSRILLETLALSPIPLSKKDINNILGFGDIILNILIDQINNNLIILCNRNDTTEICYCISDSIIQTLISKNIEMKHKDFILNRIFNMSKSGRLNISTQDQLDLVLELKSTEAEEVLVCFLNDKNIDISIEKKAEYINKLYSLNLNKTHILSKYENAKLLYEFGFFDVAKNMLFYILEQNETLLDYNFYMLLGSIQHLLLLPEAPNTFKKASNIDGISINKKLSAINREIMSLNQSDDASSKKAYKLYCDTLETYKNEKCNGLIELYRNTNNSYPMDVALNYTITGYQLAVELDNELEQYKCLHNICMIRLHQGLYSIPLNSPKIDIEPTFELVDQFFQRNSIYQHKRAYPLLDLGTYEMFNYILNKEEKHLKKAKAYYSKAQLFAKSFYARNIADMGLLITNTYLYLKEKRIITNVIRRRKELFKEYCKKDIVDYRVNRKILLSLAVSAIMTKDIEEAKNYLSLSKQYILGPEKARYDNLCLLCQNPSITISKRTEWNEFYYSSPYFVPWLISLAH